MCYFQFKMVKSTVHLCFPTLDLAALEEANSLLNREISRVFGDGVRYTGTISNYEEYVPCSACILPGTHSNFVLFVFCCSGMFLVLYEDGDQQHLNLRDIKK